MTGPREETIVDYFTRRVDEEGGGTRPIAYRGRRGCADQLAIFCVNRLFLVELKRPKGGKISVQQSEDEKWLLRFGVKKEYIYTKYEVDAWLRRVLK